MTNEIVRYGSTMTKKRKMAIIKYLRDYLFNKKNVDIAGEISIEKVEKMEIFCEETHLKIDLFRLSSLRPDKEEQEMSEKVNNIIDKGINNCS